MFVGNFKISSVDQEQRPFLRISGSADENPWISVSDGKNGMVVVFENNDEFDKFFKERREILGDKVTTKISCTSRTSNGGC